MIRNFISIGVALAVIVVLTGTACLACFLPVQNEAKAACCTEQSSCHREPAKKSSHPHAHDDCQGLPDDLASGVPAPDSAKQIAPLAVPSAHVEVAALPARSEAPREPAHPYYPPDLCLLNSQLTI